MPQTTELGQVWGEAMAKRLQVERELVVMYGHHRWFSFYLVEKKQLELGLYQVNYG